LTVAFSPGGLFTSHFGFAGVAGVAVDAAAPGAAVALPAGAASCPNAVQAIKEKTSADSRLQNAGSAMRVSGYEKKRGNANERR
jgi:hypothetical protein